MDKIKCHVCKNDATVESYNPLVYNCPTCKRRYEKIDGVDGHDGWRNPDEKRARVKLESGSASA